MNMIKQSIFVFAGACLLAAVPLFAQEKAASPAEEAFEAFFRQVQRDPGAVSAVEMTKGLKAGLDIGRPVTAASAARLYLGQTQAP